MALPLRIEPLRNIAEVQKGPDVPHHAVVNSALRHAMRRSVFMRESVSHGRRGGAERSGILVEFGVVGFNTLGDHAIGDAVQELAEGFVELLKLGPKGLIDKTAWYTGEDGGVALAFASVGTNLVAPEQGYEQTVGPSIPQVEGEFDGGISGLMGLESRSDSLARMGSGVAFAGGCGPGKQRFDPVKLLDEPFFFGQVIYAG